MTLTAIERKLMNAIHPIQLERRKASTSWSDVASVNTTVGPALDITFDKLDEYIPVKRWRSGNPDLGAAEVVSDTGTIKSYFYGTEYTIPDWEMWLRENASPAVNAADFLDLNGDRFNMQRMMRRLAGQIERDIDNDFYSGNADISFPGMIALDTSAATLQTTIDDPDGRLEFIKTLIDINKDGSRAFQSGRKVLAIDESLLGWMALPFEDTGTSSSSLSVVDMALKFVDAIVPVQNTAMNNKAFLHWQDPENVEVFDMTPDGVQIRMGEPRRGEDLKVKMFHMWTAHEYRADTVQVIDGLLA